MVPEVLVTTRIWQAKLGPEWSPPEEDPPPGYKPVPGEKGMWLPVAVAPNGHDVLWRRMCDVIPTKQEELVKDKVPSWAKGRAVSPRLLMEAVLDCLEAVTGKRPSPSRCATSAKEVIGLWRALERPPLEEFVADVQLVASAARQCPDPLFSRDIRAIGWTGGRDRSRDVGTLLRRAKWGDRLRVAREWGGTPGPTQPGPHPEAPTPPTSGLFARMKGGTDA